MSSQTGPPKMTLYSLTGRANSPFHAEPVHDDLRRLSRHQQPDVLGNDADFVGRVHVRWIADGVRFSRRVRVLSASVSRPPGAALDDGILPRRLRDIHYWGGVSGSLTRWDVLALRERYAVAYAG